MTTSIDTALAQIELSIRNLQALITELRPAALDQIGLAARARGAAEAGCGDVRGGRSIPTCGSRSEEQTRLDPEIERTLYRVIQESLTNVIKHADAGQVRVGARGGGRLSSSVTVVDDGAGFDTAQISPGFGLVGMQDRVGLVGGTVTVESAPGAGAPFARSCPPATARATRSPRACLLRRSPTWTRWPARARRARPRHARPGRGRSARGGSAGEWGFRLDREPGGLMLELVVALGQVRREPAARDLARRPPERLGGRKRAGGPRRRSPRRA